MKNSPLKPINTVFAVASIFNIKEFVTAKKLMNQEYGNKYNDPIPHLTYTLVALPEEDLATAQEVLAEYIQKQRTFKVHVSDLIYDEKARFFYLSLSGEKIKQHHKNFVLLLNKLRKKHIRQKDFDRLNMGHFDKLSMKNTKEFGYSRVFDNFESHITIGNYTVENVNVEELKRKLSAILKNVLNKDIVVDNIEGTFSVDSDTAQDKMKLIWRKVFPLKR